MSEANATGLSIVENATITSGRFPRQSPRRSEARNVPSYSMRWTSERGLRGMYMPWRSTFTPSMTDRSIESPLAPDLSRHSGK